MASCPSRARARQASSTTRAGRSRVAPTSARSRTTMERTTGRPRSPVRACTVCPSASHRAHTSRSSARGRPDRARAAWSKVPGRSPRSTGSRRTLSTPGWGGFPFSTLLRTPSPSCNRCSAKRTGGREGPSIVGFVDDLRHVACWARPEAPSQSCGAFYSAARCGIASLSTDNPAVTSVVPPHRPQTLIQPPSTGRSRAVT